MIYNFDKIIDRRGTYSMKHESAAEYGKPEGLIPLWVADMDFQTPPEVIETLERCARHAVFGYSVVKADSDYNNAVRQWFDRRHGFAVEPGWIVKTPGVVYAICMAIRAFTRENEAVMIQTPVYSPFRYSIESNGRRAVLNPLIYRDGKYTVDFDDFERKIAENDVKLFLLCSPHNPVGRVWSREELSAMGEICLRRGVIVLADEIHCDFVYGGRKHVPFASVSDGFLQNSVTFTSPSKTFNLAGLQIANTFIAREDLRRAFVNEISKTGYGQCNIMGLMSCRAAYEAGGPWLNELLAYLDGSFSYIKAFAENGLQKAKVTELEGTYLVWIDMNGYGYTDAELDALLVEKAKIWVTNGKAFGEEGRGFIRVNIASPLSVLKQAFLQLAEALK